jgi:hypothetical protein
MIRPWIAFTFFILPCSPSLAAVERVELALRCKGTTSVADGMVGPLFLEVILVKSLITLTLPFHHQIDTDPSLPNEIIEMTVTGGAIVLDFQFAEDFEDGMGDYIGSSLWALSTYGTGRYERNELTYEVAYWDWRIESIFDMKYQDIEISRDSGRATIRDQDSRVLAGR